MLKRGLFAAFILLAAVPAVRGLTLFSNNFETTSGGLTETGSTKNIWEWGRPVFGVTNGHTGLKCWATRTNGNYPNSATSYLILSNMDFRNSTAGSVSFWHKYHSELRWDGGHITLSTNSGATFMLIGSNRNAANPNGYVTNVNGLGGLRGWSGNAKTNWRQVVINLKWVKAIADFRFRFGSDTVISNYPGWFVDDLVVKAFYSAAGRGSISSYAPYLRQTSSLDSYSFTFNAATNIARGSVTFDIPAGWSVPQTGVPGGAGYVRAIPSSGSPKIAAVPSIAANKITVGVTNMNKSSRFVLKYSNATAPAAAGDYTFTVKCGATNETVQPIPVQPVVGLISSVSPPFSNSFEAVSGGFPLVGSDSNSWSWGTPTGGPGSAFSGTKCWADRLNGTYPKYSQEFLYPYIVNLTAVDYGTLSFMHWYDTYSYYDSCQVFWSTNKAVSWNLLGVYQEPYASSSSWYYGGAAFSANSAGWKKAEFDLTPFNRRTVWLRFTFSSYPSATSYDGWFIDDFKVVGLPPAARGTGAAAILPGTVTKGSTNTYRLEFTAAKRIYDGQVTFDIPTGWTNPQSGSPALPGYVYAASSLGAPVVSRTPGIAGRKVTVYVTNILAGEKFVLTYSNVRSPSTVGNYLFTVKSGTFGETVTNLASAPSVSVLDVISSFPFLDDFEVDSTWRYPESGSVPGNWQWGNAVAPGPTTAASGTKCWGDYLGGYYAPSSADYLYLPVIDLTGQSYGYLAFKTWFYSRSTAGVNLQVSTNLGASWTLLGRYPDHYNSASVSALGNAGFAGIAMSWQKKEFDLTPYRNRKILTRFQFKSTSSANSVYPGWFMDDLYVNNIPPPCRGTGTAVPAQTVYIRGSTNWVGLIFKATKQMVRADVQFTIPAAWTLPQNVSSAGQGYVKAVPRSGTPVLSLKPDVAGSLVTVHVTNMYATNSFLLIYTNAKVATNVGDYVFTTASAGFGESFSNIAVQPNIGVLSIVNAFPFFDDFESDLGRYSETGSTHYLWDWGEPIAGPPSAFSGLKCRAINLSGYSTTNELDTLYLPIVDLTGKSYGQITFQTWYDTDQNGYNGGSVFFSTNNGASWSVLGNSPEHYPQYNLWAYPWVPPYIYKPGFNGHSDNWTKVSFDLTPFKGRKVLSRLQFKTSANLSYAAHYGWYVDDLLIDATPPSAAGTGTAIVNPQLAIQSSMNDYTFVFTASKAIYQGQVSFEIPAGWSTPQTSNSNLEGYAQIVPQAKIASQPILSGRSLIVYVTNLARNASFALKFRKAVAPGSAGDHIFPVRSAGYLETESAIAIPPRISVLNEISLPFFDDFESDLGFYSSAGSDDFLWERGIPQYVGPPAAWSGSYCWGTVIDANYEKENSLNYLYLPVVDLTAVTNAWFSFRQWFDTRKDPGEEAALDCGNLSISTDSGKTFSLMGLYPSTYNDPGWNWVGENGFGGNSGGWQACSLDLSRYAGRKVFIRFRFESTGGISFSPGWYIDDLTIQSGRLPAAGTGTVAVGGRYRTVAVRTQANYIWNFMSEANLSGGLLTVDIPQGFTGPTFAVGAGHIGVSPGGLTILGAPILAGNKLTIPVTRMYEGDTLQIQYSTAVATNAGRWTFDFKTAGPGETEGTIGKPPICIAFTNLKPPVTLDFESGPGLTGLDSNATHGTWEWGSPTGPGPGAAHSGNKCWGTVLDGNFGSMWIQDYLYLQPVNLSGATNANLSFWYYTDLYRSGSDRWDLFQIQAATGPGFGAYSTIGTYPGEYNDDLFGPGCFTGPSGGWKKAVFDLSAYTNKSVRIRIYFYAEGQYIWDLNRWSYEYPGVYIDDVSVTTKPPSIAGSGLASVAPVTIPVGATRDFLVSYQALRNVYTGQVSFTIPAGWTPPQTVFPGGPGFVTATNNPSFFPQARISRLVGIAGNTVTIFVTNMKAGDWIGLRYFGATAPGLKAAYTIPVAAGLVSEGVSPIGDSPEVFAMDLLNQFPRTIGFETNDGGLVGQGTHQLWRSGKPATGQFQAYSGSNCLSTSLASNIRQTDVKDIIYTPFFDLTGISNGSLSFRLRYDMIWDSDWFGSANVTVSTDGVGFTQLGSYFTGDYDYDANWIFEDPPYWISQDSWTIRNDRWEKLVFGLSQFRDKIVQFAFKFRTVSWLPGTGTGISGAAIDEITVSAGPQIAGTGTMQAVPFVTTPSTADNFGFIFTATEPVQDAVVSLDFPAAWSEPQSSDPAVAGFLSVAAASGVGSVPSVSGTGPWTASVDVTNLPMGSTFTLYYAQATSPAAATVSIFTCRTWSVTESQERIEEQPSIFVLSSIVPPATLNFDANNGGLLMLNSSHDLWEWGVPTWGPSSTVSGTKCWGTVLAGNYGQPDILDRLYTPIIDLTANSEASMTFWHWYSFPDYDDGANVTISTDLVNFKPLGAYPQDYNRSLVWNTRYQPGGPAWTGNSGGWKRKSFDLTPYVGRKVLISFNLISSLYTCCHEYPGWYIDSLSFADTRPPVAGTGTATVTPGAVYAGTTNNFEILYTAEENIALGNIKFGLPSGWLQPQNSIPVDPGYASVVGTSGIGFLKIQNISSMTVNVKVSNMAVGKWFKLKYASVPAITTGGYSIRVLSAGTGESYQEIPNQPTVTIQPVISLFPQRWTFEDDDGQFYRNGRSMLWEWGVPTFGPPTPSASDGTKCWGTVLDGPYGVDNATNEYLLTPPIDLTESTQAYISFSHYDDMEFGFGTAGDAGNISISTSSSLAGLGQKFVSLGTWPVTYNKQVVQALGTKPGWSGKSGAWVIHSFLLPASLVTNKYIIVKFRFASDAANSDFAGWYIDDVEIDNKPPVPPDTPFVSAGQIFQTETGQAVDSYDTYGVALGDLNADGSLDLVDANKGSSYNFVYENDGSGVFVQKRAAGAFDTVKVRLADFDNDGSLDIFAANCSGDNDHNQDFGDDSLFIAKPNYVLLNNGRAEFSVGQQFIEDRTRGADTGDVDGDGDIDVFVANIGPNKLLLNDGRGGLVESSAILAGLKSTCVRLADLDADSDLDAVIGSWDANYNMVLVNDGHGVFTKSPQQLGYYDTLSCDVGDANADGAPDIVFGTLAHGLKLWINDGTGVFTFAGDSSFLSSRESVQSNTVWGVGFGDANNDGLPDIYAANYRKSDLVWVNDGTGVFRAEERNYLGSYASRDLALGDVNADGRLDFAVGNSAFQENKVWLNAMTNTNRPPSPPGSVSVSFSGNDAIVTWAPGADAETPQSLLTYNLRVGTTPAGNEVLSVPACPRLTRSGNAGPNLNWTIRGLSRISYYYFSVQTVDAGLRGSTWKTAVDYHDPEAPLPGKIKLSDNFLNLNRSERSVISFNPRTSGSLSVYIHNIQGVRVRTLVQDAVYPEGYDNRNNITWDGTNDDGKKLAPGIYWIVMRSDTDVDKQKILLVW